jgi:hypothetical protein
MVGGHTLLGAEAPRGQYRAAGRNIKSAITEYQTMDKYAHHVCHMGWDGWMAAFELAPWDASASHWLRAD